MPDLVLGLLAAVVGLLLCFWGHLVLRLVIALWAAVVGFNLGAALVAGFTGEPLLGSPWQWVAGVLLALVFAACAYALIVAGVVLAVGAVGFTLTATALVALDVEWSWGVVAAALAAGVLLAVVAIVTDVATLLLALLSAVSGASLAVAGTMLLSGAARAADFTVAGLAGGVRDDWWWWALLAVLAVAGVVFQWRGARGARRGVRHGWTAAASPAVGSRR